MDGDKGLNTGGMNAFSPSRSTKEVEEFCNKYLSSNSIDAIESRRRKFKGNYFLWIDADRGDGPKMLEYNARFGIGGTGWHFLV